MPDDIIIVVPPGTRVRYVENPYIEDDKVYVMDAAALRGPTTFEFEPIDMFAKIGGIPVYEAEKYDDG